jgi:hypothetical protein
LDALRRQPVSPKAAIAASVRLGTGSGRSARLAAVAVGGISASQTSTRNIASGCARTVIGCCAPSIVIAGQALPSVSTARATAPCGPSTT